MSFTQIRDAVNKHSRVLENYEKKLHHDQLAQSNVKHQYGVRKNIFGGHEFYLIENLEKLSFKNGIKHPSEVLKRLANLISRIKTAIYQKLRIDVSNEKKPDYVKALEDKVFTTVDTLSNKYPDLKVFGERVAGTSNNNGNVDIAALRQANEELTARNLTLTNAGAADNEELLAQVEALTARVSSLNGIITQNAVDKASLEERIRRLRTKVETKETKISQLEGRSSGAGEIDSKLKSHHDSMVEEFKAALGSLSGHFHHAPAADGDAQETTSPREKEHKGNPLSRGLSSVFGKKKKKDDEAHVDNASAPETAGKVTPLQLPDQAAGDDTEKTGKRKSHRTPRHRSSTKVGDATGTGE